MSYNGLTNQGLEYLTRCQVESKPVVFSKVKIGNGNISMGSTGETTTDLYSFKKEIEILNKEQVENSIKMEILINNFDVEEEFYVKEIGVYVMDNGVEKLYWYINKDRPSPLPDKNTPAKHRYILHLETSQMESIILNYTGLDLMVDKEFVETKFNEAKDRVKAVQFPNIESLKLKNLKVGDIVEVLGYYSAGDGAGHKRIIANEDDGSGVQLKNGLYANILHNGEVNVSWFGAKGDGVTDDSDYFNKIFKYNPPKIKANGKFFVSKTIICREINNINFDFKGEITCPSFDNIFYTFRFVNCKNININGLIIKSIRDKKPIPPNGHTRPFDSFSSNVRGLSLENCSDVNISNVYFENVENDFSIRGTSESQKCNNINITNWKSRNSSGNMFSDYTDNITIDSMDSILAEKVCSGDHNLYFGTHCKNINIYNVKFRYIDDSYGTSFQCTNGNSDVLVPAKNITIKNADIIAKSTIALGTLNADIHIYDSILIIDGKDKSSNSIVFAYDSTYIELINCDIKSNSEFIVEGTSYKEKEINNIISFYNCNIQTNYYIFYPLRKIKEVHVLNCNIKSKIPIAPLFGEIAGTKYQELISCNIEAEEPIVIRSDMDISLIGNTIKYTKPVNYLINNGNVNAPNAKIINNIFTANTDKFFNYSSAFPIFNNGNIINGKYNNLIKTTDTEIAKLNTLHMGEKMKQERVFNDFITYMDDKTAYDKQQEKIEEQRQLSYEQALQDNPNLTYEEFMSVQPMTLNLIEEPQPSENLKKFMEKYL